MKASKFSDAQKAFTLKQGADGVPVAEICRRSAASRQLWTSSCQSCSSATCSPRQAQKVTGPGSPRVRRRLLYAPTGVA